MNNYELLWECFMSEQMTTAQLEQHLKEDPEFAVFVREKLDQIEDSE